MNMVYRLILLLTKLEEILYHEMEFTKCELFCYNIF